MAVLSVSSSSSSLSFSRNFHKPSPSSSHLSVRLNSVNRNPNRFSRSVRRSSPVVVQFQSVSDKLKCLDIEFKSLVEPIDRVKRLLHYAALLPPFDDSSRTLDNRVMGCTAQVWLDARIDGNGGMRFRMDSDSEITKGFCCCLLWLFDGANTEQVLSVKTEDLIELNIGLPSRVNSRVNTWHNVLFSMQRRTKALDEEKLRTNLHPFQAFPAASLSSSSSSSHGSSGGLDHNLDEFEEELRLSAEARARTSDPSNTQW